MKKILLVLAAMAVTSGVQAQLAITALNSPQTVTFDATLSGVSNAQFGGSGFQSTPTAGQLDSDAWAVTGLSDGALAFGGTRTTASTDYTRGNTSVAVTTGGIYAFGSTDRQLMIQPGGTDWAPGTLTMRILNSTGSSVSSWTLGYELYVRNDQARSNSFNFSYSTDDITYLTLGLTGNFTYTSTAALDALGWQNLGALSATVSATVANSGSLYIRWSGADVGGSGSRDEFGIDDITVAAIPEPSTYALLGLGLGALWFLRRKKPAAKA